MRARERHASEIATLLVALESLQADVRSTEARIESMRGDHYAAGDALHERQGQFYATNAEVTRLEQQLAYARDNEHRLTQQVAQITEQIADATRIDGELQELGVEFTTPDLAPLRQVAKDVVYPAIITEAARNIIATLLDERTSRRRSLRN